MSKGKSSGSGTAVTPMTPARAAAIQSRTAITEGTVTKGSFAARAASAAAKNVNAGVVPSGKDK